MLNKFNQEKMLHNESISTFCNRFKLRYETCKSFKVPGFLDESYDGQRYSALYREKVNMVNRNIDHWPTTLLGVYTEVEHWLSPRLADSSIQRPTAVAVAPSVDMTTQFPCHTCGKLGHWMVDCPQNKSSKPSVSVKRNDALDKVIESATVKKNKKREKKHVKFDNLTVEETHAMLTHAIKNTATGKVSKGQFVFDTGADVFVCTDASMFKPKDPPEFTEIIGFEGRPMEAEVSSLLC